MKDLLITHTDLDGISPVILYSLTNNDFDYKSIEINDINDTFEELVNNNIFDNYKRIFITDLTLTEYAYSILNDLVDKEIHVFDHHETHLFANVYPYVNVAINIDDRQTCGTELFYLYLKDIYPVLDKQNIKEYVDYVRQLDTWNFECELPKLLNSIKATYGSKEFIKAMVRRLKKDKEHFELNQFEKKFTKLKETENQKYIEKRDSKLLRYEICGKKCGVIFAERNKSELGNYSSVAHPDLDLIILIDASGHISYRTDKDNVNLSEFAALFGGGGHQKASGSSITEEMQEEFIKIIFGKIKRISEN